MSMKSSRLFRALMRILPFDFRDEHGRDMEQVFRAQREEARHAGTIRAITRLWFETLNDLITTAPREHAAILRQDVAYALRTLRHTPAFTTAAVLTLAIGISGSATIFTILNAFLFRPLAVDHPEQLVSIATLDRRHIEMPHGVSYRDLLDYAELSDVFSGLLGYQPDGTWLDAGAGPDRVMIEAVTENSFSLLGVRPAIGRLIAPADARTSVVALTYDYWRTRLGGDPSVVGRKVRLSGQAFTVVGVAPESFSGFESILRVSAFVPFTLLPQIRQTGPAGEQLFDVRDRHVLNVIGRLRSGIAVEEARAALAGKARALGVQYPETNNDVSLLVVPETLARPVPQNGPMFHVAATMLSLLAALLLVITSANIANMLLARAASRGREMALRAALGARRGRVVRQLLTESLVLAAIGGAGAVVLATLTASAMERGLAGLAFEVPIRVDFGVDWRVLGLTAAAAATSGVIAGLAPALHARRADVNSLLKTGGRAGQGPRRGKVLAILIVGQIGVSFVLLVLGGLFVRTLDRARNVDLGFRADHILLTKVDLGLPGYTDARRAAYYRDARERVVALPGVRAAAWISGVPFGYEQGDSPIAAEGAPQDDERMTWRVSVTPEYFAAASVPLVAGRSFDDRDTPDRTPVAVINVELARELWPNANPIGRRVQLGTSRTLVEVVGVVRNGKVVLLWESPRPMLYQPLAQALPTTATLEVVTAGEPVAFAAAVRAALLAVDREVPTFGLQSMADYLEYGQAFLLYRIGALITGLFGALGLLLASIGLYGVVAYDVTQRTHEVGVRVALGARRFAIVRGVVSRGAWFAMSGALAGVALAAGVAWSLRIMLLDISPFDPLTYGVTAIVLIAVCLLASFVPARRAASVSPLESLRAE
jgi:predicted permease